MLGARDSMARIPQTGDHFEWDGLRFEIVDMDGRRIDRILVTSLTPVRDAAVAGELSE